MAALDGDGIGFEHTLIYGNGTLTVLIRNGDDTAVTDLAGARFVARGFNAGATAVATLGADGRLVFSGLRPDSYEVRQVRLDSELALMGFATLPTSDAEVTLAIYRQPPPLPNGGGNIGSKSVVTAGGLPPGPCASAPRTGRRTRPG